MLLFTLLYAGRTLAAENTNETDIQERRPGYRTRLRVNLRLVMAFSGENSVFDQKVDFSKIIFSVKMAFFVRK